MKTAAQYFAELEAAGIIVRTGDFRPNRMGMLEPVYVSARVLGLITEEEEQRRLQQIEDAEKERPRKESPSP